MSFQQTGFTLRLTGASRARKTALSRAVSEMLRNRGYRVEVLEGDKVGQSNGVAFSKEDPDRKHPRRRVRPNLVSRNRAGAITVIARNRPLREEAPGQSGAGKAYVACSVQAVIQRDAKGVRITQMVLNEGLCRDQMTQLLDTPFRTVRGHKKSSLKHARSGLGDHRHPAQRSGGGIGDRTKVGVTIQAVRQVPAGC